MAAYERDPGPFPTNPDRAPKSTKSGPPKSFPACQKPWLKAPVLHVRWRMHHGSRLTVHGSGARASVSVAGCGSTVVVPCNRLRRFLRPGLGLGFSRMVCSPSVSVRLSRHTDRGNRVPACLRECLIKVRDNYLSDPYSYCKASERSIRSNLYGTSFGIGPSNSRANWWPA